MPCRFRQFAWPFVGWLFLVATSFGQPKEDLSVLDRTSKENPRQMVHRFLLGEAGKLFDARRATIETLKTPEATERRQKELRTQFVQAIGGFPDKTPLNPKIVGKISRDGFVIEKIIYESRPGHHVTLLSSRRKRPLSRRTDVHWP